MDIIRKDKTKVKMTSNVEMSSIKAADITINGVRNDDNSNKIDIKMSTVNPFFHETSHLPHTLQHHLANASNHEDNHEKVSTCKRDRRKKKMAANDKGKFNIIGCSIHSILFFILPILVITMFLTNTQIDLHLTSISYLLISIIVVLQDFSFHYTLETSLNNKHIKEQKVLEVTTSQDEIKYKAVGQYLSENQNVGLISINMDTGITSSKILTDLSFLCNNTELHFIYLNLYYRGRAPSCFNEMKNLAFFNFVHEFVRSPKKHALGQYGFTNLPIKMYALPKMYDIAIVLAEPDWLPDLYAPSLQSIRIYYKGKKIKSHPIINNKIPATLPLQLKVLKLPGMRISGNLSNIYRLKNLTLLSLSSNLIDCPIEDKLSKLTRLSELTLDKNKIYGKIPYSFKTLTNLEHLELSQNNMVGELTTSITKLIKLSTLLLDHNNFNGTIPNSISALTRLDHLDLFENRLSGNIPQELSKLTKLSFLGLSKNKLSGEIPSAFSKLTKLQKLYLAGNNFTGSISSFSKLNELRVFSIRENSFAPINFSQLNLNKATLPKLARFRLENSGIQYTIPEVLKAFPNFKNSSDGYSEVFECTFKDINYEEC